MFHQPLTVSNTSINRNIKHCNIAWCVHCLLYAWEASEHVRKCEKNPVYSLEAMSKA